MGKIFDITMQLEGDDDDTADSVEERMTELVSEETWSLNFVVANHIDTTDD